MIKGLICSLLLINSLFASPIIQYQETPEKLAKETFYLVYLKHSSVGSITPLLNGICNTCDWVTDQSLQRIGVRVIESEWPTIQKAIQKLDRKQPMIQLAMEVVEVSNIESDKYQNMLSQLTKPIKLGIDHPLSLDIEYMISSGNAIVLSSPRLITRSGQSAKISVGDRVPYTSVLQHASGIVKSVEYIDSGIELEVIPHAHYNKSIDLQIQLKYRTVTGYRIEEQIEMPIIASRETQLSLQVPSGTTILFAGLLDKANHKTIEKVPILGDIPIIGGLFTQIKNKSRNTDLIYKITPSIIDD